MKYWRWEWPGNEATVAQGVNAVTALIYPCKQLTMISLMPVPLRLTWKGGTVLQKAAQLRAVER